MSYSLPYDRKLDLNSGSSGAKLITLIEPGTKILEIGPATGYMTRYLTEELRCEVTCIELDPRLAAVSGQFAKEMIIGNIETLDLEAALGERRFDYVIFADVLEHLVDPWAALRKVREFLEPDGNCLASIPNVSYAGVVLELLQGRFRYRTEGSLDRTHLRFFTRENVQLLFQESGFEIASWDRTTLSPTSSEFRANLNHLPGALRTIIEQNPDWETYQFLVKAGKAETIPGRAEEFLFTEPPPSKRQVQLFWETGDGFTENASSVRMVDFSNVPQNLCFTLQGEGELHFLRLDPTDVEELFEILSIQLWDGDLKVFDLDENARDFTSPIKANLSCIEPLAGLGKSVNVSLSEDPQIIIGDFSKSGLEIAGLEVRITLRYLPGVSAAELLHRQNGLLAELQSRYAEQLAHIDKLAKSLDEQNGATSLLEARLVAERELADRKLSEEIARTSAETTRTAKESARAAEESARAAAWRGRALKSQNANDFLRVQSEFEDQRSLLLTQDLWSAQRQKEFWKSEFLKEHEELESIRHSRSWHLITEWRIFRAAGLRGAVSYVRGKLRSESSDSEDPATTQAQRLLASGLFDCEYYRRRESLPESSALDLALHYVRREAGRPSFPNPLFSDEVYLEQLRNSEAPIVPLLHFFEEGWSTGMNPNALFDVTFYLDMHPELMTRRINPLSHYISIGAYRGSDPHPLFDSSFYLDQNKDVAAAGQNPLAHYLAQGCFEKRSPHPMFDAEYYFETYPDVAAGQIDPLLHYLHHGFREGRNPNPSFDTNYYIQENPDVRSAGINPLLHYVRYGIFEGRPTHRTSRRNAGTNEPLEVTRNAASPAITVVVPIYRGLEETRRCITSVLETAPETGFRLLLVNDKSPEPALVEYLDQLRTNPRVMVLDNTENLGFVGSVNRGMKVSGRDDVILLNSDTETPPGWVERLAKHAYSDPDIATVTPFSNNATICNYPAHGWAELPEGESVASLDAACLRANEGALVDIPTAVGSCMFIRRSCLDEVGLFDIAAFGKGYGEENDFCLRASSRGWRHVLAADTFVYHKGEVSFRESAVEAKKQANAVLCERYPAYHHMLREFLRDHTIRDLRNKATFQRLADCEEARVLLISHNLGGGTERHIQEVREHLDEQAIFVELKAGTADDPAGSVVLKSLSARYPVSLCFSIPQAFDELVECLSNLKLSRIHLHHIMGLPLDIHALLGALDVPLDVTIHDYYFVCPRVILVRPSSRKFCGQPDADECRNCLNEEKNLVPVDIDWWRQSGQAILRRAERVICPSHDVMNRMQRYAPEANYIVVPHRDETVLPPVAARPIADDADALKVVVLGALAMHKGRDVVLACAEDAHRRGLAITFHLIGYLSPPASEQEASVLTETGPYSDDDLADLIQQSKGHIIWFPSVCPETFSFTLSLALREGLPIIANSLGAYKERIQNRELSWTYPSEAAPSAINDLLLTIRENFPRGDTGTSLRSNEPLEDSTGPLYKLPRFFNSNYLTPLRPEPRSKSPLISIGRKDQPSVVAGIELLGGHPSPCAYIRIIQPLSHAFRDPTMGALRIVPGSYLAQHDADAIVAHRLAVPTLAAAKTLVDHCRQRGIKLAYDLDDDLFALEEHPEASFYEEALASITLLLSEADEVWVSTEILAQRVARYAKCTRVIRNVLDESLWHPFLPQSTTTSPVGILFMGTASHIPDLEMVAPALTRIKKRFGDDVRISAIGPSRLCGLPDVFEPVPSPSFAVNYRLFARWLRDIRGYHIGIAPLKDSAFNRAKSEIKLLEYTALGLATVASDIAPYRSAAIDGVRLVSRRDSSWEDALSELIESETLRRQSVESAQAVVGAKHLLSTGSVSMQEALEQLIGKDRIVAPERTVHRTA